MLRCFSSLGCPELSLDAVLALAAKHRIDAVELRSLGATLDLSSYFAAQYHAPARLAARLQASAVRVVALNASLHLVGATPADREQLVALAPWAEAAGIRWLRVFDGGKNGDAAERTEALAVIGWWREVRRQRGWQVDLMVETHDALFNAGRLAEFISKAPGTAILWDAHHTWRKGGEDPVVTWRAIRDRVVHVHIKDSIGVPSGRHPFTYVLPGDGDFPIGPLMAALRADNFAGPVSLEWERLWHPSLPPLEDALVAAEQRGWW